MALVTSVVGFSAAAPAPALAATPTVIEFDSAISSPSDITAGPDGNLWFTGTNRIGRITPAGTATEFTAGITGNVLSSITTGPDGNLWFTEQGGSRIGRITPSGTVTEFNPITANSQPNSITDGPDGNLWFTEQDGNKVGRITPAGAVTEFGAGISPNAGLGGITAGPDGNLWFTEFNTSRIGRITPAGVVTEFSAGIGAGANPVDITTGPDGNLWFPELNLDRIARITPSGTVTEFSAGIAQGSRPVRIAAGADGNLWFVERETDRVGRITPTGVVTEFSAGITDGAFPVGISDGPDGNLWFTENDANKIGRISTAQDPPAFASTSSIAIPAAGTAGPAGPYPSELAVAGLGGTVTDVRVRLGGLAHSQPDDLEYLLQAPSGATALLGADAGGLLDVQAANLTFDDASSFSLLDSGPLVSGVFRLSSFGDTSFPAPAPQPPYGTNLAAFDGISPNGSWKLFINDDAAGDAGILRGGWGLAIDTNRPPLSPLDLTLKAKPKQKVAKLKVKATCSITCDLSASASGKARGDKFKSKVTDANGLQGAAEKLKLTLKRRTLRKVKGDRGRATIAVTATDPDGQTASESVKVKLK